MVLQVMDIQEKVDGSQEIIKIKRPKDLEEFKNQGNAIKHREAERSSTW